MGYHYKTHCKNGHEFTPENSKQTYHKRGWKNGRQCRTCQRERSKLHSRIDKTGSCYRGRMKHQNKKRYGMNSVLDRDVLLKSQNGKCAVCGTDKCEWGKGFNDTWHIDHDHNKPGTHRGILCAKCNLILGKMGDDIQVIQKFIDYLIKYKVEVVKINKQFPNGF